MFLGGGYRTLLLSPAAHAKNPTLRPREHQTGELSFSDPDSDWIHYPDLVRKSEDGYGALVHSKIKHPWHS